LLAKAWEGSTSKDIIKVMDEWEKAKRIFTDASDASELSLDLDENHAAVLGLLDLTPDDVRGFFQESLNITTRLIRELLEPPKGRPTTSWTPCRTIILIGGVMLSKYVQAYLQRQFPPDANGPYVFVDEKCAEAVVGGAVILGAFPESLLRCMRTTYAIPTMSPFMPGDPENSKVRINDKDVVRGLMKVLVNRGEHIGYNHYISLPFRLPNNKPVNVVLYEYSDELVSALNTKKELEEAQTQAKALSSQAAAKSELDAVNAQIKRLESELKQVRIPLPLNHARVFDNQPGIKNVAAMRIVKQTTAADVNVEMLFGRTQLELLIRDASETVIQRVEIQFKS
jgi:hypothetical protein